MSEGVCRIIPNYGSRCISPANPSMRTSGTYTGQYKGKLFQSTPAMYALTHALIYATVRINYFSPYLIACFVLYRMCCIVICSTVLFCFVRTEDQSRFTVTSSTQYR